MTAFNVSQWVMDKTGASSDGGMVVAKQEQAALAGARMLAEGGNAIDAAVAAAWVMAVMEPHYNTIGGSGHMVYRQAGGRAYAVDFSVRAPARATQQAVAARTGPEFSGPLAAAVPGTVAGLARASEQFGRLPLARVMEPAIAIAEEGMPISWTLALQITLALDGLRANPHSARVFLVDGDPGIARGQTTLRQPDLAHTLRKIAEHGPDVFYKGEIGRGIVDFVQGLGGLLEMRDFAEFQPTVSEPLRARFRDYDLLVAPLPSPCTMTAQGLQMLAHFDLAGMGHNSADALHVMAETYRMAFADRDAYLGDPDFCDAPVDDLLSAGYAARRAAEIDPKRAMETVEPGDVGRVAAGRAGGGGGTTHLAVVDADGNAVSHTQTLIGGLTGLGVAGNTGVVMNCSLQWFDHQANQPNSVGPRKRPVTNMTPLIAERDGRAVLAVGAPGSRRISNAVGQVTLNVLEHGMPVQQAISAPRIDLSKGHIVADDRIDPAVIEELRARGHKVELVTEFLGSGGPANSYRGFFARPAAVYVDDEGIRHGGDYPYAEGAAVGVPKGS
jgi:gamma-glutamyltranspeptidase / glutathione hydrolase